jgi:hypothetical protein
MESETRTTRRAMLLGAAGALGAFVAEMMGRPPAVQAGSGESIVVGGYYNAEFPTTINNPTNGNSTWIGLSQHGGSGFHGSSSSGSGVKGVSYSGYGVDGLSTLGAGGHFEGGPGVAGISPSGYGGFFNGGTAQLRLLPKATAGKPTTGGHLKGEIYMDSKGAIFVCTVNGTPGTWKRLTAKLV